MKSELGAYRVLAGCVLMALALQGASSTCHAVQGVIVTKDKRRIEGDLKWKASQRSYVVMRDRVQTEISLDTVGSIDIPAAPPGLETAIKQVQAGGGGHVQAIPVLKQICIDYEMLKYDVVAARYLAEAYTRNGQPKEAVTVCDKVRRDNEGALGDAGFAAAYADALLASDQIPRLKEMLNNVIELGSREAAAFALTKRGEMEMKRNNYKDALIDGYLRVAVLFEDVREAQPEALYQAAKCFDQLGQAPYAERMRKKLLQAFPQSPQAERLKAGK